MNSWFGIAVTTDGPPEDRRRSASLIDAWLHWAVMFTADAVPGLADGSITVTFRRWKRPQAKVGGTFHKGDLWFEVDAVRTVPVARISKADARRAGEADCRRRAPPPR